MRYKDYDADRFDCEVLLDRLGYSSWTVEAVGRALGIHKRTLRQRLTRGHYPRPAIEDAANCGFLVADRPARHEWSREQVIDMMLYVMPKEARKQRALGEIEHGTYKGYAAERRRKMPICDACKTAATNHTRLYNQRKYREKV